MAELKKDAKIFFEKIDALKPTDGDTREAAKKAFEAKKADFKTFEAYPSRFRSSYDELPLQEWNALVDAWEAKFKNFVNENLAKADVDEFKKVFPRRKENVGFEHGMYDAWSINYEQGEFIQEHEDCTGRD
jgi:hypothetical protein